MKLKTMIYNFYNNFGEEPDNEEDDDDFDEDDDEDEEDNEEGEDGEKDESGFGEDIGDGYGEDTVDPLDAQERAEAGEDDKEKSSDKDKQKSSDKEKGEKKQQRSNNQGRRRRKGHFNKKMATQIAKKHPFSMSGHVEARCAFCRKQSIVRCRKSYIRISTASLRIVAHKQFTGFYCVNPKCKMSFQRDYIQMAAGNAYQGAVVPMRELLKVSKT